MDSPILSSSILLENQDANFLLSLEPIESNENENVENESSNPKDMIEGLTSKIFNETIIFTQKILKNNQYQMILFILQQ